jgi:putative transposase
MIYKGFGRKLHHAIPSWVEPGAVFHIRIRCAPTNDMSLIQDEIGRALLDSVRLYTDQQIWFPTLWLLMPDHVHALVSFAPDKPMSQIVGDWKRWQSKNHGVRWQENFFDHRIRGDEQLEKKFWYIRNNPVVKGLCAAAQDWPWYYVADGGS